jgi:hypothetical protein
MFSHGRLDRREPLQRRFSLAPIDVKHRVPEQRILEAKRVVHGRELQGRVLMGVGR